MHDIIQCIDF